jgi:CRP/FNR family transcriptional regulator
MIASLRESKLFAGIPDEIIAACADHFTLLRESRRSEVFRQGDPGTQIYCVIRGLIRIGRLTEDGEDFTVRIAGPGDVFGDESLFGCAMHAEFATTLEDCIVAACRADHAKTLMMRYPLLGFTMAKCLRERHDRALSRIQRMEFNRAGDHLLAVLHELAAKRVGDETEGARIEVPLTHAQLASLIGTTRETVSYELRELARKGFLFRRRRKIVVPLSPQAA